MSLIKEVGIIPVAEKIYVMHWVVQKCIGLKKIMLRIGVKKNLNIQFVLSGLFRSIVVFNLSN